MNVKVFYYFAPSEAESVAKGCGSRETLPKNGRYNEKIVRFLWPL